MNASVRPPVANADGVMVPSYGREGVPLSLLEAVAMAKPMMTTDTVRCCEVVEAGVKGLLVSVKDAKALASAARRTLSHPERRTRMDIAGGEKAERMGNERVVLEKIGQAYEQETP